VPVEGAEGKVLYVWFDAPIGYISNTKELCDAEPERWGSWEKWWKDPETRLVHFIGKDNIVFHCLIFPVMLKAHGGYILPDNVPANEFLNLENDKISTSRNWAVWLDEYLKDFPGKQDVLRYVLTANAPETKDNNFTWKDFQERNNSELVAIYGNFVNRALQLTKKYWNGVVPACGELLDVDKQAIQEFKDVKEKVEQYLDNFKFREAQKEAMNLARIGNKYITECEPWKVWKTDPKRVETILNISLQLVANLAIAFEPFLPSQFEEAARDDQHQELRLGRAGQHRHCSRPVISSLSRTCSSRRSRTRLSSISSTSSLPRRKPMRRHRLQRTTRLSLSSPTSRSTSGRSSTSAWDISRTAKSREEVEQTAAVHH
jgi:methionyl-tRNA synthetase